VDRAESLRIYLLTWVTKEAPYAAGASECRDAVDLTMQAQRLEEARPDLYVIPMEMYGEEEDRG
jgi:hypothetical protein